MQTMYIALGLIFVILGYIAYEHMNINKKLEKASLCKAVSACGAAPAPTQAATQPTVQAYHKAYDMPKGREKYAERREPKRAN